MIRVIRPELPVSGRIINPRENYRFSERLPVPEKLFVPGFRAESPDITGIHSCNNRFGRLMKLQMASVPGCLRSGFPAFTQKVKTSLPFI